MKRSIERETFLADIITTAVEGGINDWSQVSEYRWFMDIGGRPDSGGVGGKPIHAYRDTYAVIHRLNDDETAYVKEGVRIGIEEVASAIQRILRSNKEETFEGVHPAEIPSDALRRLIQEASDENDAGYLDAYDASAIVQVAVLGSVVYG